MGFSSIKFMGCSVRGVSSSIGWSQQKSQLTVQLVQDLTSGDKFLFPAVGTPAFFTLSGFSFAGLVNKYIESRNQDGDPVYQVIVEDPRDILANTTVLLNNYNGPTNVVSNLLNVYGFWENLLGFGGSLADDAGIPYSKVLDGIQRMTGGGYPSVYGAPLSFRGFNYAVDMTSLPVPPPDYRITGTSVSLLELISQICEDGAHDFFVDLVGSTIMVRAVSRLNQPPLGTITSLLNTNVGNVISTENGVETRNETTSSFLVGGPVQSLNLSDNTSLVQFWGFDVLGNPLISYSFDAGDGFGEQETANLNCSPIADIIGDTTYTANVIEMRFALTSYDSWATYIMHQLPTRFALINLIAIHDGLDPNFNEGMLNASSKMVNLLNSAVAGSGVGVDAQTRSQRVYEFVKNYATEFYGKKYAVQIPFVLSKLDPQTLIVSYSQEPTDGGALPDGATPLGLSNEDADVFMTQDGRFTALVKFLLSTLVTGDLSSINPSDTVNGTDGLYMKATVDNNIIFVPAPAVIMTLSTPIYNIQVDITGGVGLIDNILNGFKKAQVVGHATFPEKFHPAPIPPDFTAVPLKSNVLNYGPWYISGPPGKTAYLNDTSLVPWNYGGFTYMNLAGNAKVLNAISNMQITEAGSIELAEAPRTSLGHILLAGGPNVTNINIKYNTQGVSTSYRFETFTRKFGIFARDNAERLKRIGQINMDINNRLRQGLREAKGLATTLGKAYAGWNANIAPYLARKTPYPSLLCTIEPDGSGSSNMRVGIGACTNEEFISNLGVVGLSGVAGPRYQYRAGGSWSNLIRPFTTEIQPTGGDGLIRMSSYRQINNNFGGITRYTYNPYQSGNDIELYPFGDNYSDIRNYKIANTDNSKARPPCLRGPLVISSWGYGIDGLAYPGDASGNGAASFYHGAGTLKKSNLWPAGPIDLLFDPYRDVWTSHDMVYGRAYGTLAAGTSGQISLYSDLNFDTQQLFWIFNPFSAAVASGVKVQALYAMHLGKFLLSAADC